MSKPLYPAIPDPSQTPESVLETVLALKQAMELITGQRGADDSTAFTSQGAASLQQALAAAQAALNNLSAEKMPFSLFTTHGDIIWRNGETVERFPIGSNGQVLRVDGGNLVWATPVLIETWTWLVMAPEDGDDPVVVNLPHPITIKNITTQAGEGTGSLVLKVNGTPIGNTNALSTTLDSRAHDVSVSAGSRLDLTWTDLTSDIEKVVVTMATERVL